LKRHEDKTQLLKNKLFHVLILSFLGRIEFV